MCPAHFHCPPKRVSPNKRAVCAPRRILLSLCSLVSCHGHQNPGLPAFPSRSPSVSPSSRLFAEFSSFGNAPSIASLSCRARRRSAFRSSLANLILLCTDDNDSIDDDGDDDDDDDADVDVDVSITSISRSMPYTVDSLISRVFLTLELAHESLPYARETLRRKNCFQLFKVTPSAYRYTRLSPSTFCPYCSTCPIVYFYLQKNYVIDFS